MKEQDVIRDDFDFDAELRKGFMKLFNKISCLIRS